MLVIYEKIIPCKDCKFKENHNDFHHPHTEILFSFRYDFSGKIIEKYNKEELQTEMRDTGLSATQFAIRRCQFLAS